MDSDLIPGLNEDSARKCLIRIPLEAFRSAISVCKARKEEIRSSGFHLLRKKLGQTRPIFILAKTQRFDDPTIPQFYRLAVFDPDSGSWTKLPQGPNLPKEFKMLCGVVGVGSKVVVISALESEDSELENMVHVFDLLTGQWCRGAKVPKPGRLRFGLDGDPIGQRVLLASGCGMDGHLNAKRIMMSALMYDVANNTWTGLRDIKKEREECIAVFHGGKFRVISGYSVHPHQTTCTESLDLDTPFDLDKVEWVLSGDGFLEDSMRERSWTVTGNGEGDLYYVGRNVAVRRGNGDTWEEVSEMPDGIRVRKCAMTWQDKMVVIGGNENEVNKAYLLDLKRGEWTKELDVPDQYSKDGIVVGCGMEL